MRKLTVLIFTLLIQNVLLSQSWEWKNPLPQGNDLLCTRFSDPLTGYAVGMNGKILKTYDCGESWSTQNSGVDERLISMFFYNDDLGFVVGEGQTFLKTTNGGDSWEILSNSAGQINYTSVFMTGENVVYLTKYENVYNKSSILKSIDCGLSFFLQCVIQNAELNCINFTDQDIGFAVGNQGIIVQTINGGDDSWSFPVFPPNNSSIYSITFPSSDIGFISTSSGIYRSNNGGVTWSQELSLVTSAIYFLNENLGFTFGLDYFATTYDSGLNWTISNTHTGIRANSIFFTDANTGIAVGYGGAILKTTNGGGVGIKENQYELSSINVFPNPAKNEMIIEVRDKTSLYSVDIYTSAGALVLKDKIRDKTTLIDASFLAPGLYFIHIHNESTKEVIKFVKE